jgi:UDP-glucose 4-epimerase
VKVLVTGGAGYVGSVIAARLAAAGHEVTVYDDLSRGHRAAVPPGAGFVAGDVRDRRHLRRVLRDAGCRAVVHMAALAEVAESVAQPERYRDVNVAGTEALAAAAAEAGVERVVFSSTAAVYGEPRQVPIEEDDPTAPTNPYGETKLAAEAVLREAAAASVGRLSYIALRYFNACGADGDYGEDHDPETHLIPMALRAARQGTALRVFGDDYPTPDGTCVRDYVHVVDLADAHIAALHAPPLNVGINLGTGTGQSVLEVVRAVEGVTARALPCEIGSRRAGDPPALVASNGRAADLLGWRPHLRLERAVADAWRWLQAHPRGYEEKARPEDE